MAHNLLHRNQLLNNLGAPEEAVRFPLRPLKYDIKEMISNQICKIIGPIKIILIQDEFKIKCTGFSGCSGVVLEKEKSKQNFRIIKRKSPKIVRFQDFLVEISGIEPLLFVCLKDSQMVDGW